MTEVYILGEGYDELKSGHKWPYRFELIMDDREERFCMSEGSGHAGSGGSFSAKALLDVKWRENFEKTRSLWVLPILEEISSGKAITNHDILFEYQKTYNEPAKKSHWKAQ